MNILVKLLLKSLVITQCLFFVFFNSNAQQTSADSIIADFLHHPEHVIVVAHRSAHQEYPENSLAAMNESIRQGIDVIEIDIRQTKDGALVIMHDETVDRTTTGKGKVGSFTLQEIKELSLLFNDKPTEEKVPTFEEVLQLTKGKIMIDIDFKIDLDNEKAIIKTIDLIERYDMGEQMLFYLYDYKYIPQLHALNKHIKILPRAYNSSDVEEILEYEYITVIHADDSFYNDSLMKNIRDAGVRVWINALGKYDEMERQNKDSGFEELLEMKYVNVIQTDLPVKLLMFLKERDLHR